MDYMVATALEITLQDTLHLIKFPGPDEKSYI
jgi:hypothetical protein